MNETIAAAERRLTILRGDHDEAASRAERHRTRCDGTDAWRTLSQLYLRERDALAGLVAHYEAVLVALRAEVTEAAPC